VLRVATSQMYAALVPLMARKAVDLDRFALLPFGGAGPTHGFLLAREVGISRLVIPPSPGVLCAIGSLVADVRRDFVRTIHEPLRRDTAPAVTARIRDGFHVLADAGRSWLEGQGLEFEAMHSLWSVDVRYVGQSFELMIAVTDDVVSDGSGEALRRAFHTSYGQVYGYTDESADVAMLASDRSTALPVRERRIYLDGASRTARVLDRASLTPGVRIAGPAIVEQYDTTVLVPPGYSITLDHSGNLIGEATDGD
jgi:N-methylhydantoinase A